MTTEYLCDDFLAPGFHVCGIQPLDGGQAFGFTCYKDGSSQSAPISFSIPAAGLTTEVLFQAIDQQLGLSQPTNAWPTKYKQKWGAFAPDSTRLNSAEDVLGASTLFIIEGGQFIWPGVRVGFTQKLTQLPGMEEGQVAEIVTLSLRPLVFEVCNFLKDEECTHIIDLAQSRMHISKVVHNDADRGKADDEFRTSTQAWVSSAESAVIQEIDRRVQAVTGVPVSHQEEVQVLNYGPTQKYNAHLDCFDPSMYQQQPRELEGIEHGHRNRLATVFWYVRNWRLAGSVAAAL
jgi:prolyl 4-hydroxylase